jgi:hypothetical protein
LEKSRNLTQTNRFHFEVQIFELPEMRANGRLARAHWALIHKHTTKWRMAVQMELIAQGAARVGPWSRVAIECTRASVREPDFDNLVSSFKPLIDGIVDSGLIEDDNSKVIVAREYLWTPAPRGKGWVKVVITRQD